ncbi:uncharacterized protein PFLUO_LOCUS680 [Penicillium psychrofluorescens]|uniref:uncharacterized protein n=1 Tax=Penicillium psychrofluorescens TaxID=3158075 RepID=UPI003CCD7AA8
MSFFFDLDLSKNYSLYTVPLAWWLAHGSHVCAALMAGGLFNGLYDNLNPRTFCDIVRSTQTIDSALKGRILRAEAAAANGFETLGFYAASIVAANYAGLEARTLNLLSFTYIASRVVYVGVYIWVQHSYRTSLLRSGAFCVGIWTASALYVKAGMKLLEA